MYRVLISGWVDAMRAQLFLLLMLISGFAGISYEILYGRILGNMIGDQFAVSAAILITFLFGIGIGARFAWRLWPWLWLIELLIGVCGIAFVVGATTLDTLLYASLPLLPDGLAGSIIACVILLLLPSFLIGCSVPLFAGYMSRLTSTAAFPKTYAIYNIGAAITAILIEYMLLRWLGINGTVLSFAALNVLIAVLLRYGFVVPAPMPQPAKQGFALFDNGLFNSGGLWLKLIPISMASAVFQLLMVKLAEMFLGPFRESFALVLSIVLLGIALGSIAVRLFKWRFESIVLIGLVGMLLFMVSVEPVTYLYASLYAGASASYLNTVLLKWGCLLLLMGIPALAFGATVPALINGHVDDVSKDSGHLLFVASMANVVGFLLMVFVLHRYLDYGVIVLVISLLCGLSLLLSWLLSKRFTLPAVGIASVLLLGTGAAYAQYWDEDLLYVSYTNFRATDELNDARRNSAMAEKFKGYQDVFAINWVGNTPYFFINGYNSIPLNNPSEKIVGVLSSMYARQHDNALVLGLGSGATASVVGQLFAHSDVVEINPVVRENLFRMRQWNFDIESNRRVNIIVDDAIHYTKVSDKKYDLILNTVTTPLYFSSSKLYTRDFFEVVKRHLNGDGIYVTWMDARVGDKGADIILNSIRSSFKHCALLYIKSSYFLLISSDQPIRAGRLPSFKAGHPVYDYLLKHDGIIPEWLKYQLLTDDVWPLIADTSLPLNEADYPALEFEMARLSGRGITAFKTRLRQAMALDVVQQSLTDGLDYQPAELVWHAVMRLKNSSFARQWKRLAEKKSTAQGRDDFEQSYAQVQQEYFERLYGNKSAAKGGAEQSTKQRAKALHKYGYRLMRARQFQAALRAFEQVLLLDATYNNTHFNMAACYEYLGDFERAIDYYQREMQIGFDDEDVPYRIGRVLVKMQRYGEAIAQLDQAIALMGEHVESKVYEYLAKAYAGSGQYKQARQAHQQAVGLRSDRK